ncbi:MAG: CotH kinase family protein [Bacteroidia bacterium]
MIIRDRSHRTFRQRMVRLLFGISLLTVSVILIVISLYVVFPKNPQISTEVFSGAESRKLVSGSWVFYDHHQVIRNGNTQSADFARNGHFSAKITNENRFGFYFQITDFQPGDHYYVSVWRKKNSDFPAALVVNIQGENPLYVETLQPSRSDERGWELLEQVFTIPTGNITSAAVYVFGSGAGAAYFDDFQLNRISHSALLNFTTSPDTIFPHLNLFIDREGLRQLSILREKALENAILVTSEDSWVKGKIIQGDTTLPVKLRLKGDWVDHLRTDKWSYRIQMKPPFAWNRLLTFSIHHPRTRHYLHEWVFHQMLMREGVLATRYDFATVSINQEPKGVYAFEEHFEKQLPESQSRREGPIVKFNEAGVWNARVRRAASGDASELEDELNTFESADIQPFDGAGVKRDSSLKVQFEAAKALFYQFQFGEKPASEVFDVELTAKFYAITDITRGYHNLIWHNLRFYYNPVTARLEPIGFDGFSEGGNFSFIHRPVMGALVVGDEDIFRNKIHARIFKDPLMVEKYIFYLRQFSSETYLRAFLLSIRPELESRQKLLLTESPEYKFEEEVLLERGKQIQALIFPLAESAIMASTRTSAPDSLSLDITNFHILPLAVVGFGRKETELSGEFPYPILLPPYEKSQLPVWENVRVPSSAKYVFYRLPGLPEMYTAQISPWALAMPEIPRQNLFEKVEIKDNDWYTVNGKEITFFPGRHTIDEDIIIPAGYRLEFLPGTEMNFVKKAALISASPVFMHGEEDLPIVIRSGDGTGQGFTVLQAKEESWMSYVQFSGMNTLQKKSWNLTGAVTFYESPVKIANCSFTRNHCEDALNLVRSKFELNNSHISHTFMDGLDVDFSVGTVKNCTFTNTGNDATDFSGSQVFINDCIMENVGDKGVSVGEKSTAFLQGIKISGAVTGVASKDLSEVTIESIDLVDCKTGFAAYRKKPEFGGGKIRVKKYSLQNVTYPNQIEPGSVLKME